MSGVDIHAFPPELPPNPGPDTDDVGGDELDRAGEPPRSVGEALAAADAAQPTEPAAQTSGRLCQWCEQAPAAVGIYYVADGTHEWACYPCHAAVIARALNDAADMAEGQPA